MVKYNGYTYSASYTTGKKIRWRCSTHQHQSCPATIHTIDDFIVAVNKAHNHHPKLDFSDLEYVMSNKGNVMIKHQGYMYHIKRGREGPKKMWRCSRHNTFHCKATLITIGEEYFQRKYDHNH
ncbi:hypothetical protein MSG28_008211 [Choristoneura fumiferana]|uniref:Uncharacterized protein n=1 Tax=Choristoneura fumiferana TaxID=7141 RepID=A0ACC0JAG5_CHOFU|nr:hypothetical protein MSG28_008211 [Choristoneura fumiferana]